MDSFSIPSPQKTSDTLGRRPIVTQQWLAKIAELEALAKALLERAKREREGVLKAVEAGAPVEPGKYKVRVRTRWRRRKVS